MRMGRCNIILFGTSQGSITNSSPSADEVTFLTHEGFKKHEDPAIFK